MRVIQDSWLVAQFGGPVFRVEVEPEDLRQQLVERLPPLLRGGGSEGFFHTKVAVKKTGQVAALEDCGFRVVDVNVSFGRQPGSGEKAGTADSIRVAPVSSGDSDAVIALAEQCFTTSRFHLDPLIPNEVADRINGAWVADYVTGRRGVLLDGAYSEGRLVGFNAVLEIEKEGKKVLVIDLIGVDPEVQAQGIGAALVDHFLEWSAGRCDEVSVGTQVANVPAVRMYEKKGFRLSEARYVLHAHLRSGEVLRVGDCDHERRR